MSMDIYDVEWVCECGRTNPDFDLACNECGKRRYIDDEVMNQCDGCERRLPVVHGIHYGEGYDMIGCTASRYEK